MLFIVISGLVSSNLSPSRHFGFDSVAQEVQTSVEILLQGVLYIIL